MSILERRTKIKERLRQMNWHYGRGEVTNISFSEDKGGYVNCKLQYGTVSYKFRVSGNTLYFRGHQSRFDREMVIR